MSKASVVASAGGGGKVDIGYRRVGERTVATEIRESGALRIRQLKGVACRSVLVNTAGGIVAGDSLSFGCALGPASDVLLTTAAAEKVYRSASPAGASLVEARLTLAEHSRLIWLPQETMLFDTGRLRRRFAVDLAATAELVAAELLVFGRRAHGEADISGFLHDSWRVRREGRLVFADETRIEGAIGRQLARRAAAGGHHAVALLLVAGPRAAAQLEPLRAAVASATQAEGEGAASLKNGIVVARLLASSAERLRAMVAATMGAIGVTLPSVWQ